MKTQILEDQGNDCLVVENCLTCVITQVQVLKLGEEKKSYIKSRHWVWPYKIANISEFKTFLKVLILNPIFIRFKIKVNNYISRFIQLKYYLPFGIPILFWSKRDIITQIEWWDKPGKGDNDLTHGTRKIEMN